MQAVVADGVGLDLRTLQAKIGEHGAMDDAGGMSYRLDLDLLWRLPTYADLRKLRQRRERPSHLLMIPPS